MTPNTTRTITLMTQINAAGLGTARVPMATAPVTSAHEPLAHMEALGIEIGPELADGLEPIAQQADRLAEVAGAHPRAFTVADLAAANANDRLTNAITATIVDDRRHVALAGVRHVLATTYTHVITPTLPGVFATLAGYYAEHAEHVHAHDAEGLTGAERDIREAIRKHTLNAVEWFWSRAEGEWCDTWELDWNLYYAWTPSTHVRLVNSTAPGLTPRPGVSVHHTAIAAGGVPRLAASYAEATTAALDLRRN